MTAIWARQALLPDGWQQNVLVTIDAEGQIAAVRANQPASGHRVGVLLPAPANAHSHAFQRAMAGLTERRGPDASDSFWTWRRLMYRFLDRLTPDHVEAIAAFVQMEMLESGYGTNVEFHYLHHQPGGQPYDNLAEMSARLLAASDQSGIGLTLLPVHYQYGGCDKRPLGPGQIRFGNDPDRFQALHEDARQLIAQAGRSDNRLGVAPHSLRAVAAEDLPGTIALAGDGPIHMHLAEQLDEVSEVEAAWGLRPVDWLLNNHAVDDQWCLIHCSQMNPEETIRLARSGAIAGLCPLTEASLGDGIFDGVRWFGADGHIAIGSDSNIRIALAEELRLLDYTQRLRDHSRAALATADFSTGRRIFDAVVAGGSKAAGRNSGAIVPGVLADLIALDDGHIDLAGRQGDVVLDSYIFAGDDRMIQDVWSAGRHMVQAGRHVRRAAIVDAYRATMAQLKDAL